MTRIYLIYFLFALSFILIPIVAIQGAHQLGVPPSSEWDCPVTHPVKGNFTTYSGESCIAHLPGGVYYNRTKPERCFASLDETLRAGCRASSR